MANDFLSILDRLLNDIDSKYDKRESSLPYEILSAAALEFSRAWLETEQVKNEGYADTAGYFYLKKRAKERGLVPYPATAAVVKGKFDKEISIGTYFTGLNTTLNYYIYEYIGNENGYYFYKMMCTTEGASSNDYTGAIIPMPGEADIEGLGVAEIVEIIEYGQDEESLEAFRERYFNDIHNLSYSGNIADYKRMMIEAGAGGSKIYPVWNGGGTVKAVIISPTFTKPTAEFVSAVQDKIDPLENQGKGVGLAGIDHIVTIKGVEETTINVAAKLTFSKGYDYDDLKDALTAAVETYLNSLNADWEKQTNLIVRITQIESAVMDIQGIEDIENTTINNLAKNLLISDENIVKMGALTWTW